MAPMKLLVHILVLSGAIAAELCPASADDAGSAIRDFGLVGTWSADCSKDLKKEIAQRTTFVVPSIGKPTIEVVLHASLGIFGDTNTRTSEIQSATRITEDKLEYVSVTIKSEHSNPAATNPASLAKPFRVLMQKKGAHMQVLESGDVDQPLVAQNGIFLRNGLPTPETERCLNNIQ
jgi:hypothetical protein